MNARTNELANFFSFKSRDHYKKVSTPSNPLRYTRRKDRAGGKF